MSIRIPRFSRRRFLTVHTAGLAAGLLGGAAAAVDDVNRVAAERLHAELWRRFVDEYGIVLDETDLDGAYHRPTPEECRLGQPNAVGWLTPIANGGMFTGLYLDAIVLRARRTGAEVDRRRALRLVEGLLLLSEIGGVPGFIARGPATDGRTTYPLGSNDQTMPWYYGLCRYLRSGLADDELRGRLIARMTDVADLLAESGWRMPALPPFGYRGSFAEPDWDGAPRLLFLLRAQFELTGESRWEWMYRESLSETAGVRKTVGSSRRQACELGVASRPKPQMWTGSVSNACLRELWELEQDEAVRAAYARGLSASAAFAAEHKLPLVKAFDVEAERPYNGDWRMLLPLWRPQQSSAEATAVSEPQRELKHKFSPRLTAESRWVRESAFAAWIITQSPRREDIEPQRVAIESALRALPCERLHQATFFAFESAWERLNSAAPS